MTFLRIIIIPAIILFGGQVYSQTELQATSKVIVDDGYDHAEMSVNQWGGSHGLFFGAKVNYSGSGHLWAPNNTIYAQGAGPFNYGAFSMGYIANGGPFSFYDGGLSTGTGNAITWNPVMSIVRGGNIGIGTTSPRGLFDVGGNGDIYLSNSPNTGTAQSLFLPGHIFIAPYNGSNVSYLQARRQDNSGSTQLQIRTYNSGSHVDAMLINSNGNVGIGTVNPQAKLAVNGDILSRKVKVTQTGWADYVFYANYRLRPLSEVEQYIQQHCHLPEVPSAAEVEKEGLDLGDNQVTLLKKIEELTLYLIEQNKKLQEQSQKLDQQQREIDALKKQAHKLNFPIKLTANQ